MSTPDADEQDDDEKEVSAPSDKAADEAVKEAEIP